MENAVEALKMAFAVILLTLALTLSINMFSKARSTSEIVLQRADATEYYDYLEYTNADTTGNRVVGFETIIPTLYKYNKERYKVVFKRGKYNTTNGNISISEPICIYKTTTNPSTWAERYINDYDGKNKNQNPSTYICSFDIAEEIQRGEPWVGSSEEVKKNLDAIISGGKYILPQYGASMETIDYSQNINSNFSIPKLQSENRKFVELIGKVTTTEEVTNGVTGIKGNKTTTKTVITYVLIN